MFAGSGYTPVHQAALHCRCQTTQHFIEREREREKERERSSRIRSNRTDSLGLTVPTVAAARAERSRTTALTAARAAYATRPTKPMAAAAARPPTPAIRHYPITPQTSTRRRPRPVPQTNSHNSQLTNLK